MHGLKTRACLEDSAGKMNSFTYIARELGEVGSLKNVMYFAVGNVTERAWNRTFNAMNTVDKNVNGNFKILSRVCMVAIFLCRWNTI